MNYSFISMQGIKSIADKNKYTTFSFIPTNSYRTIVELKIQDNSYYY